MTIRILSVAAGTMIAAVMLPAVVFAQAPQNAPDKSVHVSGRLVDPAGKPLPNLTLNYERSNDMDSVKPTEDGRFSFFLLPRSDYKLEIAEFPEAAMTLEAAEAQSVDLGDLVVQLAGCPKPMIDVPGLVHVTARNPANIAVILIPSSGGLRIIHGDGKEVQAPVEKDQVGVESLLVSDDNRTVGWLASSPFCCTSYPLSFALIVYRPGKPIRRFTGDGRAIFGWKFVGGGRQVAFEQSFPHGELREHYELRDVETGRLIDKWDGALTSKAPKWTRGMRP